MSFRLKTIILIVALSLAPYVITMAILGNAYRQDVEQQVVEDLQYQLDITLERMDQQLESQAKDLRFLTSLDIMNDILTGDLDRRIFNLLSMKKDDLQLLGEIEVTDSNQVVVASTDTQRVGQVAPAASAFLSIPIHATFDDSLIGNLLLHYEAGNLTRFFENAQQLHYSLRRDGVLLTPAVDFDEAITVAGTLSQRPEYTITLQQDRAVALAILDQFARSFIIALLIGMAIIAVIAYLVANYIVHPILLLSSTARLITRTQDYTQRVEMQRSDEIGKLAAAFNKMIAGMQDMLERLREENLVKLRLAEEKNRAETLQTLSTKLSRYLSPQIYESIFSGEKDVTLGSSRKKLTIFFSDIVNFTGTTDQMESEDLTALLNHYLNEMSTIALAHGATIDKYIGDAIMIFFGDPQSEGVHEDARRCVEMALAMRRRVAELQDEWQAAGFTQPFNIRVGIHTGYCTVGNFGTENRMDYTIVGSAVNLASRIETSAEPGDVCISEDTWLLVRDQFHCEAAAKLVPKGLSQPVQTYRVVDAEQASNIVIREEGLDLRLDPSKLSATARQKLRDAVRQLQQTSDEEPGDD